MHLQSVSDQVVGKRGERTVLERHGLWSDLRN